MSKTKSTKKLLREDDDEMDVDGESNKQYLPIRLVQIVRVGGSLVPPSTKV